jgi:lipopolysaccharide transport protein LptA
MWLTVREFLAHAMALVVMSQGQTAAGDKKQTGDDAPLEYRADAMQVLTKPNRMVLRGNVVVRRGPLMVCCETFEGLADEKWGWQQFVCTEKVVARRGDETMWANRAEFMLETSDLILTGEPLLERGKSYLEGNRIIVDTERDRARVEKPRGRIHSAREPIGVRAPPPPPGKELPATCPLPADRPELAR